MATTIQIKRSSTASGVPLATDLAVGELAVNLADKRLFTKQSDGTIIELSTNPTDLDAATLRIDGVEITASATELNKLDGFTGSTTELNTLDGLTASTAEINTLDGITATTTELNYVDGVTSNIQTQLDGKATSAQGALADSAVQTDDNVSFGTGSFSGEIAANGGIALGDNDKATFGASDDLQIFHDGSNSWIQDLGAGSLILKSDGTYTSIQNSAGNDQVLVSYTDVKLANSGNTKLATTATGVDVTGTVTADGLVVDGDSTPLFSNGADGGIGVSLELRNTLNTSTLGNGNEIKFIGGNNNSRNAYIRSESEGSYGRNQAITFGSQSDGAEVDHVKISDNGDVSFYEDTGTTAKFVWDSSAESLSVSGKGNFGGDSAFSGDGTIHAIGSLGIGSAANLNAAINRWSLRARAGGVDGAFDIYDARHSQSRLTINSSGKVGIGTSSPVEKLYVNSTSGDARIGLNAPTGSDTEIKFSNNGTVEYSIGHDDTTDNFVIGTTNVDSGLVSVTKSGNVGIGAASPSATLELSKASGWHGMKVTSSGESLSLLHSGVDASIENSANGATRFYTNGSERARIDSSGNLLVGKTSSNIATSGVELTPNDRSAFTRANGNPILANRTGSDGEIINLRKDGSTVGSIGTVNFGDLYIGTDDTGIYFNNGVDAIFPHNTITNLPRDNAIDIGYSNSRFKDLYLSGGVKGTNLTFSGNNGTNEHARIDSSGNLLVGKTSTALSVAGTTLFEDGTAYHTVSGNTTMRLNRLASDGDIIDLRKDGTTVGSIGTTGGDITIGSGDTGVRFDDGTDQIYPVSGTTTRDAAVSLGWSGGRFKDLYLSGGVITSSDYRLKEDIQPMQSYADTVKQMNLVNFAWKDSGEREDGFIAHELQSLVPSAVRGDKDAIDEDGNEQYQGVDPLKLIPVLTKALQEALERIETLENK